MDIDVKKMQETIDQANFRKEMSITDNLVSTFLKRYGKRCYLSKTFVKKSQASVTKAIRVKNVVLNTLNCMHGKEATEEDYKLVMKYEGVEQRVAIVYELIQSEINKVSGNISMKACTTCTPAYKFNPPKKRITNIEFEQVRDEISKRIYASDRVLADNIGDNWNVDGYSCRCNDSSKVKLMENKGARFIKFNDNRLIWLLDFHPCVYGDKILVSNLSIDLLEDEIRRLDVFDEKIMKLLNDLLKSMKDV